MKRSETSNHSSRPTHSLKTRVFLVALFAFCLFLICDSAVACPNCKNSVDQHSDLMGAGFAWSIALMLAVPSTLVSIWFVAIRRMLNAHR